MDTRPPLSVPTVTSMVRFALARSASALRTSPRTTTSDRVIVESPPYRTMTGDGNVSAPKCENVRLTCIRGAVSRTATPPRANATSVVSRSVSHALPSPSTTNGSDPTLIQSTSDSQSLSDFKELTSRKPPLAEGQMSLVNPAAIPKVRTPGPPLGQSNAAGAWVSIPVTTSLALAVTVRNQMSGSDTSGPGAP